jgi:hypothetical protein
MLPEPGLCPITMKPRLLTVLLSVAALLAGFPVGHAAAADPAGHEFFEKRIRPVLVDKCYSCHSEASGKRKGGLLLDSRDAIHQGGDHGAILTPGDLKASPILEALRWVDKDRRMPPKEQLSAAVVADFEEWIRRGAPDPREGAAPVSLRAPDLATGKTFWSFQPPKAPAVPAVKHTDWPRSDIDRFVLATLELKGIEPVADADPRTLIRRVSFDLVGLPPAPEVVEKYAANPTPEAYAKIVDDLLASRFFGERWGRHWLDVARYAESTGKERNNAFPEAWRYRDWVIDALNAGMPYDEFIRRQVAGDLMPTDDLSERDRNVVATGFLAVGPKGLNERRREQFLMELVDEQIDVTTRAVLGVTVACARCHDHKFDPISQKDYYAMAGIFRSSQTLYGTVTNQGNRQPSSLIALGKPAEPLPPEPTRVDTDRPRGKAARQAAVRRAVQNRGRSEPEAPLPPMPPEGSPRAMGVREGRPMNCALLVRGEISQRGDPVPRGFVEVLNTVPAPSIPPRESGRRQLAEWLTRPENPLTARVEVNRAWLHLFGRGIVRTADDFGALGEKPTHPELLDHLAVQFASNGWSLKKLLRELVLSRTYQLSSDTSAKGLELDPDNTLLWRSSPRRLDAEAIRDAMLAVAGILDTKPPEGSPVAAIGDGPLRRGADSLRTGDFARKRSVYLPVIRGFVPESMELFDFAEPSLVVADRDTTNVPAQALYLMNNEDIVAISRAFARRLLADGGLSPRDRIDRAYRLAFGRPPTPRELLRAAEFLRDEIGDVARNPGSTNPPPDRRRRPGQRNTGRDTMRPGEVAWTSFTQALFASAEFRFVR